MATARSQLYLWRDSLDDAWFLLGYQRESTKNSGTVGYFAIAAFHIDQLSDIFGYEHFTMLNHAPPTIFPIPVSLELSLPAKAGVV